MMDIGVGRHALADAIGLSQYALHDRLSGRVAFLPVELRRLFLAFPDPRLADHLLASTAYTAIRRPAVIDSRIGCSPIRTGLLSLREIVQFLEALLRAENVHDASVLATAGRHLDEAVRQVAALRWNMTHIGRHDQQGRQGTLPRALPPGSGPGQALDPANLPYSPQGRDSLADVA
jgi:hypothetical protein